jgi:hypothetical protein
VAEWKSIRFKDAVSNEFGTNAIQGADHAADAARYFLMSRPRPDLHQRDWIESFQRRSAEARDWRRRALEGERQLIGRNPSIFEVA